MTIQAMAGFDHFYNATDFAAQPGCVYSGSSVSFSTGRLAGKSMSLGFGDFRMPLQSGPIAASTPLYVGMGINSASASSNTLVPCFGLVSSGGIWQVAVGFYQNYICVYRPGGGGTNGYNAPSSPLSSSSTGYIGILPMPSTTAWFYIESEFTLGTGTSGSVTIRLNGATSGTTFSGVTTMGDTTSQNAAFLGFSTWSASALYDDVYCNDTGFLGDVQVQTLYPNANSSVQFTPASGSNYAEVDATSVNIGTTVSAYNASNTTGQTDLFAHGALVGSPSAIYGVRATVLAEKDASYGRVIAPEISSSGTLATTNNGYLSTSYQYLSSPNIAIDPATGAAWTASGVNAALIGYSLIA